MGQTLLHANCIFSQLEIVENFRCFLKQLRLFDMVKRIPDFGSIETDAVFARAGPNSSLVLY